MTAGLIRDLSLYARLASALAPLAAAILLRIIFGKNRFTRVFLSASTIWLTINLMLTPYSAGMKHDLLRLQSAFR